MYSLQPQQHHPDDGNVRQLSDEDQQVLLDLVRRYGAQSLVCALGGYPASSRASVMSTTTLLSATSVPSLAWTGSEATQYRSDGASIHTTSTWGDGPAEPEFNGKMGGAEQTWLDSPAAIASPVPGQDQPSPRLIAPTSKKYQCPTCYLDANPVGFGRKSDFKKHLYNFHGVDVTWICRTKGCYLSYATERAYTTHAKDVHRMDALPASSARTELCPQVVFSCGFGTCKDRFFESNDSCDAAASRDKYFEHIAKHFEDGFDVHDWEYKVQIHNLMRQSGVKSVWKNCVWPKEKRQGLSWKPRSSGDLKRMLECRHLGDNISTLTRLAWILGTAPFTLSGTPPPSEIDMHFQLPHRAQCLLDTPDHEQADNSAVSQQSEATTPSFNISKHLSYTPSSVSVPSVFRLSRGRMKRETRPSTPTSAPGDTYMNEESLAGPHPGTPISIPSESAIPLDAPKFAPEGVADLPRHMEETTPDSHSDAMDHHLQTPVEQPLIYEPLPSQESMRDSWYTMSAAAANFPPNEFYACANTSQASIVRPATPTPHHKRPGSWSRVASMESMRPSKKAYAPEMVPNMYGEMLPPPTSIPYEMHSGYDGYDTYDNTGFDGGMVDSSMTFFIDDGEGRL